ncbi:hypothetical protein [endosymbiont of Lamellibrachia barhami]|uniref:hypothetical protein n=1 Tax=endosymbiont of Lamellibrachia barhami TaxID=205975 RepID=UPI0015A9148C|nr:hypothetical protein [endosymbiont of Lamellibrachia barhami]
MSLDQRWHHRLVSPPVRRGGDDITITGAVEDADSADTLVLNAGVAGSQRTLRGCSW